MTTTELLAVVIMIASSVQQGQSNPAVGFSAGLSNDTSLAVDETIKYDMVLTNVGNGYDKWCGHFQAPLKGLYVFSCTVMAVGNDVISVVLMKNGKIMANAFSSSTTWESGAITILLDLQKGDRVWMKRFGHGRTIHKNYNWFTGYLISTKI